MDYLSLKAAVAEIEQELTGARISDGWQTGKGGIVLVPQRGKVLLLSADPVRPGLFLLHREQLPVRTPSPITDLLQSRIKGTTLVRIGLTAPGERLAAISFAAVWPAREDTPIDIMVEVMGRRSNLMVTQDGRILYPLRVVPGDKSPARPIIPGGTYNPPPMPGGTAVEEATVKVLTLAGSPGTPEHVLETVRGLSPYTARQAILRARSGSREEVNAKTLAAALVEMVSSSTGDTGYLHRFKGRIYLAPFKPVVVDPADEVKPYSPFSAAAGLWRESPSAGDGQPDGTSGLEKKLSDRLRKIDAAYTQVDSEEARCKKHDETRVLAEALLIHAGQIEPGSDSVTLPDPYDPGIQLKITLNPTKNPHENASDLFAKARRLKRGLKVVSTRREKLKLEKRGVQEALKALEDRGDPEPAIRILDLTSPDKLAGEKAKQYSYSGPGRKHAVDGFTILVGKSSTDNEKVTFKAAGPNDLWLHARDFPGSHVVILTERKPVPDSVLYAAAGLAARGSGAKNDTAPEIMVTQRKWVRKLKGGKPGQVTVERFKTIRPRSQEPGARSRKK